MPPIQTIVLDTITAAGQGITLIELAYRTNMTTPDLLEVLAELKDRIAPMSYATTEVHKRMCVYADAGRSNMPEDSENDLRHLTAVDAPAPRHAGACAKRPPGTARPPHGESARA